MRWQRERKWALPCFSIIFPPFWEERGSIWKTCLCSRSTGGEAYGKGILKKLAAIALERGCGRLEWWCLDWNKPSIDFYLSLGAEPMSDWTVYRIAGDTLRKLGGEQE